MLMVSPHHNNIHHYLCKVRLEPAGISVCVLPQVRRYENIRANVPYDNISRYTDKPFNAKGNCSEVRGSSD